MSPGGRKLAPRPRPSTNKSKKQTNRQGKKHQFKPPNKKGRIVIRNIPFKATEDTIRKHFAKFGEIREVNLLKRPDGNPVGCGFVQFNKEDHAQQAIENCSGKDFMGRKLTVDWALQQAFYIVSKPDEETQPVDVEDDYDNSEFEVKPEEEIKTEDDESFETVPSDQVLDSNTSAQRQKKKRMRDKQLNKDKKGRVIVRNLPFKITEDGLRKHFSEYGELSEVTLLKKPDGRMVGCGFVQFTDRKCAAKAILECSGKPLLGRPIVLDWAVQKTLYTAKKEPDEDIKMKEEPKEENEETRLDETLSADSDTDADADIKSGSGDENDSEIDDDDEDGDDNLKREENEDMPEAQRQRIISNDVSEGRTVFIKNVPFSASDNDLKECVEKFGPVFYALVCVDRMTEHSKGTAFVKFKTTESAEACLSAGTDFTLNGQVLDPHRALNRDEVHSRANNKANPKAAKDNRNLFLIKEGVILAGSPAAANVSITDMAKRLQLEQWKSQMLRNLNMFVARDRLAVHNIPPSYDDKRLREMFQKHVGPNAVIKEARVMRDMRNVDVSGVAKSKETGFVKFSTHEDALKALRSINNNPTIFSTAKRPIVAFSIENRAIHKVRQLREQKSRAKNPTYARVANVDDPTASAPTKKVFSKADSRKQRRSKLRPPNANDSGNTGDFTGVAAKPGATKLRTKFNLKKQAALHTQAVRKDKTKAKSNRKIAVQKQIREELITQPKQKQGKRKSSNEEESFSKLINKYVKKISSASSPNKWYDA